MSPRPSDEEFRILKWLLERLRNSEDFCEPYFDRAKRHYKLFRFGSAVAEDDWPYINRVRSRDILAFIEDSTAILIQTLLATMPFISVIPRETRMMYMNYEGIDPMLIGDQMSRCLDYQISHEDTEFFPEIVDYFKGGTIYGNSYIGVYPKFDEKGLYLRPLLKTTDFWDVMPITGAKRVSKAKGVFVREFCTFEDLAGLEERGVYRNTSSLRGPVSSDLDPEKQWHDALLQECGMTNYLADNNNIEVIHYFSGGHVITFANRKAILRNSNDTSNIPNIPPGFSPESFKPFPYDMPIVQYKYMPIPLEFFAMGIPEVLEILQEDKNLIRSARRDNIDLVINKIIKARAGADLNFDLFKYYPGAIWPMENLNDVAEMDMRDVTQSSYNEENQREKDMENALSLFGYARGMTPQHAEQPTTVMKLQQASLNRLDLAVKLAEFGPLQNIATRIILLTRRYMPQSVYEAIIGDKDAGFYRLKEEDIRRFYHFKPIGSSISNVKEIRQQQMQAALQMIMAVPPQVMQYNIEPFTVNLYQLLKDGLDALDNKNVDRILIKLQPPQQMGGGGGMLAGMQGGGQGGGMGNPNEMQALANIMYGEGGALQQGLAAQMMPQEPQSQGGGE